MRTGATLFHYTHLSQPTTSFAAAPFPAVAAVVQQRSPWHSPVPYLFGGLAAMLGLIAFALLILACSYWKLSTQSHGGDGEGEKGDNTSDEKTPPVFEEKFLVIMAGEVNPTYLATPVCTKKIEIKIDQGNNDNNEKKENGELEQGQGQQQHH